METFSGSDFSGLDDDTALVYIRLVRQESAEAAAVIEQIYILCGSHAALRAALIIVLLKNEIQPYHALPDIGMYTYLLKDAPAAIPLLEQAITHCLTSWGIPQTDKSGWGKWQRILEAQSNPLLDPFEELLQRLRAHSPLTAVKLEQIYRTYGYTVGCYGATALIWLEARVVKFGYRILMELSDEEIKKFTYFEYMSEKQAALDQFSEMIECYRMEQRPASISAFADPPS